MPPVTELTLDDDAKRRVLRANLTYVAILVPILGLTAVSLGISTRNVALAVGYACVVLAMIPLTYVLARHFTDRSRVTFGDGSVTVQGWGRPRRFTVAEIERVVTVDSMGFGGTTPMHHLIVVGPTKRLALLVGQMWDRDQLSAVALDLAHRGVPLNPVHQPVTPVQLRAMGPPARAVASGAPGRAGPVRRARRGAVLPGRVRRHGRVPRLTVASGRARSCQ